MREDLLREVYLDLQEQQRRNEETERLRKQEVRAAYPGIAALMDRREELVRQSVRDILAGRKAPEDLAERMESVSGEIRRALAEQGLPENYLSPVYSCPECRDTGYTGDRIREKCACVNRRYQEKLRRAIGLPEDGRETFGRFDANVFSAEVIGDSRFSQRELMNRVRDACEDWADRWPDQPQRDMLISGKSGLGKTFLLHAMASRLIERGVSVLLLSVYSFLDAARKSYFDHGDGMEELIGVPVLMLDDLGSEPLIQNVTIEQLFRLISERQRRNLATVVSTNLNQEELKNRYTERIASRLTDTRNCLYLPLRGRDIRNGRG